MPLSDEGLKSLLDIVEGGSFAARYHVASIPAAVPRVFAVNSSDAEWFENHGLHGLVALCDFFLKEKRQKR